jgi:hypothetical protein
MREKNNRSNMPGMYSIKKIHAPKYSERTSIRTQYCRTNASIDISMEDMYNIEFSHKKYSIKQNHIQDTNYTKYETIENVTDLELNNQNQPEDNIFDGDDYHNLGGDENEIQIVYKGE